MIIKGGAGAQNLVGTSGNDTIYGYDPDGAGSVAVTPLTNAPSLSQPLYATYAPGDANGLYIVQKGGVIVRYDIVTHTTSTFLTVGDISTDGERGVLGLAFHPDYNSNGRFFVYATDAGGDVEIREYSRSGGAGSTVANSAEVRTILTIEHSSTIYHNGGAMVFNPMNGLLYVGVGDAQTGANAQNGGNLLGKILRIDVNSTDFPGDSSRYYHVPSSNYFANSANDPSGSVNDAIFAMGLRNPWRISFDASGNLWIGDVGEGSYEEVDFIAAGSTGGQNFQWPSREGAHNYNGSALGPGVPTDPLYEYSHSIGQSITGGFVYDGPEPALQGKYIFGDFTTGKIFALEQVNGAVTVTEITSMLSSPIGAYQLASFGLDADHNLYAVKIGGSVVLLSPQAGGAGVDGNDTLDGGAGADALIGGPGDDVYITDASDTVVEQAGQGTDTIRTAQNTYTLTFANVENVTFIGSGAFKGTGNSLANVLTGGAGADTLDGGGGADTLIGGLGDDTYIVANSVTIVTEASGQGTDTVRSSIANYTIGANVENLVLIGGAINGTGNGGANTITGNASANTLSGGDGADTLIGGGGADTLLGGTGDDLYIIDDPAVVATENQASGSDTVRSSVQTYTLNPYFDHLILVGAALNGFGNEQNNMITGNANANTLKGFGGSDTLDGGAGSDTVSYSDASGGVTVSLATAGAQSVGADQGSDTLISIENLIGSNFNDTLTGDAAANTISGGRGLNSLNGGAGIDTIDYSWTTLGTRIDFGAAGNQGQSIGGGAEAFTDQLAGFERALGGSGADSFVVRSVAAGSVLGFYAGAGADTADFSQFSTALWVDLTYQSNDAWTTDTSSVNNGTWRIIADLEAVENIVGTAFSDWVAGDTANNRYVYTGGSDVVDLRGGDDTADFSLYQNAVWVDLSYDGYDMWTRGGSTLDSGAWVALTMLNNVENLIGTTYSDALYGVATTRSLSGGGGDDTLFVRSTQSGIVATYDGGANGSLGDTLDFTSFGAAVWVHLGYASEDVWTRGNTGLTSGAWRAIGDSSGIENLTGSAYNDDLAGDGGANRFYYTGGFDLVDGQGGSDTADFSRFGSAVWVDLTFAGVEAWTRDNATLSSGNWRTIADLTSVESLTGSGLGDWLVGSSGANTLTGGLGADTLSGGAGPDSFVFDAAIGANNVDQITDYNVADDTIVLENGIFTALTATGALSADYFRVGSAAADANDFVIYNSSTGALFYDSNGNGAGGSIQIATLSAGLALTATDFLVL